MPPRLLIYEPSFERVREGLAGLPVEVAVMDREGAVKIDGQPIAAEEVHPEIAWFSGDLYLQPATRAYVSAVMASPSLKWFHSAAAGFDNPFFLRIAAKGPRFTTSHGQAVGMAEYIVWGVLDHFQRGPERREAQARAEWKWFPYREVLDSTWLIIGFGAIGQGVARRAKGFGAKIIGVRRNQASEPDADLIIPIDALPAHLPHADVVVLCAPLNEATRHIADAPFFAAMKPGSVIANVGRGALVDEPALLAALETGAPGHALLDVFEVEPLPAESPFWNHPKVSLTAHCSGVTGVQDHRNADLFVDNLGRYLSGAPLLHEIDPADLKGG